MSNNKRKNNKLNKFKKLLDRKEGKCYNKHCQQTNADVAELADALVLGTSVNDVGVQVPSSAPMTYLFELTDGYEINQKWLIFLLPKITLKSSKRKDGVCNADN